MEKGRTSCASSDPFCAVLEYVESFPWRNHSGDTSVASLPLNDVREVKRAAGRGGNVDVETRGFRHSEGEARGIPGGGHTRQYQPREGLFKVILYEL